MRREIQSCAKCHNTNIVVSKEKVITKIKCTDCNQFVLVRAGEDVRKAWNDRQKAQKIGLK